MKTRYFLIFYSIISLLNSNTLYSKEFFVSKKDGIHLYNEPNKKSKIIIDIHFKNKINITDLNYDDDKFDYINDIPGWWKKIKYKNKIGYVFSGFVTEISPNEKNAIVGEYYREYENDSNRPTNFLLYPNNTFKYYINLCHFIGEVSGKYSTKNNFLILKFTKSNFKIAEKDKISLYLVKEDQKLKFKEGIPHNDIGCEFDNSKEIYFVKK